MPAPPPARPVTLTVNGRRTTASLEPRTSLLDALREQAGLTGTKKGCDQGACGACTVLVDGRRVLGCLTLAMQAEGCHVVTIEGVGPHHPLQDAVVHHDGLQCGFCTPGQVCSALGMLAEHRAGAPSLVTEDLAADAVPLTSAEIRERMSGNLCRCGAHNGLVAAVREVAESGSAR
ncbi:2Fe-2S iron-sulfur cluster binding domain-containing protein [Phycicoccus sp. CSK15P-2]|uniref:2Fe-2S iron-sulfur cluster-binding protein n=1 Tax=Phycicoccus sp. CSK15P-2 TaxID=2807627 RepID=UPI00195254B2|nr:2Fe-2S iron-sulfur cluster-binding protein [Phycicoccus sp. CSK15P-2]MBM6404171.1 2Fe-2S iron-sulfur cluster binding domain-containing protein [Phycicoccus sp. CSK15P-2]